MADIQELARTALQLERTITMMQKATAGLKERFTDEDWSFYADVHEAKLQPSPRIDAVYIEAANRHSQ